MVLSPSSLAHGMERVEATEGSDEVEGWGGGEVVAGGEAFVEELEELAAEVCLY